MPRINDIKIQIDSFITKLIELGLSDDQNFPYLKKSGSHTEITFPGAEHTSVPMKDNSYSNIYDHLKEERAYLVKMADGAIIQMMYAFVNNELERHRLCFFPSPHLEEFQNNPELYIEEEVFADIIAKKVVPFPFRFDFDSREEVCKPLEHPKSHLTLGQYSNCRIPVSAPLTPLSFLDFLLRNFYNTAHYRYHNRLFNGHDKKVFAESITREEKEIIFVQIPE